MMEHVLELSIAQAIPNIWDAKERANLIEKWHIMRGKFIDKCVEGERYIRAIESSINGKDINDKTATGARLNNLISAKISSPQLGPKKTEKLYSELKRFSQHWSTRGELVHSTVEIVALSPIDHAFLLTNVNAETLGKLKQVYFMRIEDLKNQHSELSQAVNRLKQYAKDLSQPSA